ncbi:MAG: 2-hydroxyacid dehydrogenase [Rhizobiaceae bacterium]
MALLINVQQPEWMTDEGLREELAPFLPGKTLYYGYPDKPMPDVTMLAVVKLMPGLLEMLPNLKLVQKLGAGVDGIVGNGKFPSNLRLARLRPDAPADEIAEYCLAYVLRFQRNMPLHETSALDREWMPVPPRRAFETTVAVLGLGHIGARIAKLFTHLGFHVIGWSRTQKTIHGVECHCGTEALDPILSDADYVVSILPSTNETIGLFHAERLAGMKAGAVFINAGRGDLIVDEDLVAALNAGRPAHAILDVFPQEPLPKTHKFWNHPCITVTPHVSGWHLGDGIKDVAENYLRLCEGRELLNEVDPRRGY